MTTIEFEALRKQMRAEAAARRAAQKATAAEQGVANLYVHTHTNALCVKSDLC